MAGYGGGKKLKSKTFVDSDGAQLFVQRGLHEGEFVFDTDPDSNDVDTVVSLTREQVRDLKAFLQ